MAKEKKLVEMVTPMSEDFAKWYTDVVKNAELIEYSGIKGCMILRPNGYAIWENIQKELDARFKATGVENVYMPMFIPESLLQKEKEHVEGFAPEVAWVTHGGSEELAGRLAEAEQVLCIVNTRKRAQQVYEGLPEEGRFHLSTLMIPTDREETLNVIRARLRNGQVCRVVSTSLVEAGVDVDFPSVWRELAGLDSILQAAGRCNREGKRAPEESIGARRKASCMSLTRKKILRTP